MGKLYGGATGFTNLRGIWCDDENGGQLLDDEPIMIQSLAKREDVEDQAKIRELAKFLKRMGKTTKQVRSRSSLITPFTISRTTTDMNELDQLMISRILGSTVRAHFASSVRTFFGRGCDRADARQSPHRDSTLGSGRVARLHYRQCLCRNSRRVFR